MYTGNIDDDDDDPYGSNFNRRFYVDKGFRISVIAIVGVATFFTYIGLVVVQELYIDSQAIGFGDSVSHNPLSEKDLELTQR
jgi:hypothetical protein